MRWILIVSLCLFGCLQSEPDFVDSRVIFAFNSFKFEAAKRHYQLPKSVRIKVGRLTRANGLTSPFGIVIDSVYLYNQLSKHTRYDSLFVEATVFHELGHFFMKRDHNATYSIMCPSCNVKSEYASSEEKREQLINELFNGR